MSDHQNGTDDQSTAQQPESSTPGRHIELPEGEKESVNGQTNGATSPTLTDSKGWDGKLRVDRTAVLHNPHALSDPEYSDEENVLPGEEISADEGSWPQLPYPCSF